jgi:hypothetical protein
MVRHDDEMLAVALAFRPYVGKSTPQLIYDSLVVADERKSRDESRLSRLDSLRHAGWCYWGVSAMSTWSWNASGVSIASEMLLPAGTPGGTTTLI